MKLFDAAKTVSIIEIYKKYTNNPVKGKEGKNGVTVKCPFHDDRKPSLGLFTKDNGFFCYNPNCHEKGDSIDFVRKLFNLSNYEAAIKICKDFGVEYEGPRVRSVAEPKEDAEDPEAILLNNKRLTIYFVKCLEKAPNPKFFEERGVGSLSHEYWFGYCPKGKDAELAAKCGIEDDSPLTMFGGRYIIPIITANNKVIGFVGRLPDAEVDADHPKYLNSENSSVFKKRCVFFNEKALYDSSFSEIIVVEGPFDALSFIASGVRNVVSPLGANLSDQQLSLLRRKPNRKVILGLIATTPERKRRSSPSDTRKTSASPSLVPTSRPKRTRTTFFSKRGPITSPRRLPAFLARIISSWSRNALRPKTVRLIWIPTKAKRLFGIPWLPSLAPGNRRSRKDIRSTRRTTPLPSTGIGRDLTSFSRSIRRNDLRNAIRLCNIWIRS